MVMIKTEGVSQSFPQLILCKKVFLRNTKKKEKKPRAVAILDDQLEQSSLCFTLQCTGCIR